VSTEVHSDECGGPADGIAVEQSTVARRAQSRENISEDDRIPRSALRNACVLVTLVIPGSFRSALEGRRELE